MSPEATSARGLKLLVYEALSYVCAMQVPVHDGGSVLVP
jgi:hypothetical protein